MTQAALQFQQSVFKELLQDDGLCVLARGLGLSKVFLGFLKRYSSREHLVFVLNTDAQDERLWSEELVLAGVDMPPRIVTNEYTQRERATLYAEGGCLFITSRILVVDMLSDRIPFGRLSGLLVNNAHQITELSQESFIARLVLQKTPPNRTAFVKAFSDRPTDLQGEFGKLEKLMRSLHISKVFLWPRFHLSVCSCLEKSPPEVVELMQPMTPLMRRVQRTVIELMEGCLSELKRTNRIDVTELTVEDNLHKSFDLIVRSQLDAMWNSVPGKTKRLVADLGTLRRLFTYLLRYDAVTFYTYLETLRAAEGGRNSQWMLMDAAHTLFNLAKERVYTVRARQGAVKIPSKRKAPGPSPSKSGDDEGSRKLYELVPNLEENPKWGLVVDILKEIREEAKAAGRPGPGRVLILTSDERSAALLRGYLLEGGDAIMRRMFRHFLVKKKQRLAQAENPSLKDVETADLSDRQREDRLLMEELDDGAEAGDGMSLGKQVFQQNKASGRGKGKAKSKGKGRAATSRADGEDGAVPGARPAAPTRVLVESAVPVDIDIMYESLQDGEGAAGAAGAAQGFIAPDEEIIVHSTTPREPDLSEIQPRYVIIFDPDPALIRAIEVYQAQVPARRMRVYFSMYESSVEEQRFRGELKREKDSFERLIDQKANMAINMKTVEDSKDPMTPLTNTQMPGFLANSQTRAGGREKQQGPSKVVVDVREFRSSLPSILHLAGVALVPVTLEIGDYILSPEICVERKSISDLYSSFASGRLYQQAENMSRHYATPVLLIEFDESRAFSLQSVEDIKSDITISNIISRLVLLTLHFPSLRILWCHGNYATADLFQSLKMNREQPDEVKAAVVGQPLGHRPGEVGVNDPDAPDAGFVNMAPQDILKRLPGIGAANYRQVMAKVRCLSDLFQMSKEDLNELIGPGNAKKLIAFLDKQPSIESLVQHR